MMMIINDGYDGDDGNDGNDDDDDDDGDDEGDDDDDDGGGDGDGWRFSIFKSTFHCYYCYCYHSGYNYDDYSRDYCDTRCWLGQPINSGAGQRMAAHLWAVCGQTEHGFSAKNPCNDLDACQKFDYSHLKINRFGTCDIYSEKGQLILCSAIT